MTGRQAELRLAVTLEDGRRFERMAPVRGVDAVDRRSAVRAQCQQRADPVHGRKG